MHLVTWLDVTYIPCRWHHGSQMEIYFSSSVGVYNAWGGVTAQNGYLFIDLIHLYDGGPWNKDMVKLLLEDTIDRNTVYVLWYTCGVLWTLHTSLWWTVTTAIIDGVERLTYVIWCTTNRITKILLSSNKLCCYGNSLRSVRAHWLSDTTQQYLCRFYWNKPFNK